MSRYRDAVIAALAVLVALAGAPAQAQDAAAGEKVFNKCKACHAVGEGAKHKVGPQVNGVFGRTAGTAEGYKYSNSMAEAGAGGLVWSHETIAEYLANPRGYVKGNKMAFAGLKKDEEIANVQIITPVSNPGAPQGVIDPQIAIMRTASGKHVDVELFVTTGVGYEVRTEVVGERGSAIIGLDVGMIRKSAAGTWGGHLTPGFRERFGRAYDIEIQRWVDAVHAGRNTGNFVDGPTAWDGYAAAAVCAAGVESLATGLPVDVQLAEHP